MTKLSRAGRAAGILAMACVLAAPAGAQAPDGFSPAEKTAANAITAREVGAHVSFLSDDLLEGRAPGSRGERLAARYIAAQMAAVGLEPGGEGRTFFQKVPLVGIEPRVPKSVSFFVTGRSGKKVSLSVPGDLVIFSGTQREGGRITSAPVVFVGYGIVAPEYQWDDYKGVDVRGKVVVVMNNDPAGDPELFAGKARLRYGRWDYKYLQAAKQGALGAIIIHTTPSAGYPFQVVQTSNTGERFELPEGDEPRVTAKMWATEDAARRLAALGGHDLDELRAAAERRDSRPVPLGLEVSLAFSNTVRKLEGENVIGRLPGADPQLAREAVIYTAHHDHLGVKEPKGKGDTPKADKDKGDKGADVIYNGALDNASGVGLLLAIARGAAGAPRPKRSLLFAAVTAEEQGLLGSAWYTRHPTIPPGHIAANLNMDSINIRGRTSDFGFIGYGKSTLDGVVDAVARAQGRTVHGDPFPEKGIFYRSDQFSFARVGVPGLYGRGGPSYIGRPPGWGKEQQEKYERERYHQPSDEYDPKAWDLAGGVEDGQLLLVVGLRVANDPKLPAWKPGDEFEAARKKALEAVK